MATTSRNQELVYEALASALYNNKFMHFEGEFAAEDGRDAWRGILSEDPSHFQTLRQNPKQLRVTIELFESSHVVVKLVWRNVANGDPTWGKMDLRLQTAYDQDALYAPVEKAVVRILEIFRDILAGTGVAGKLEEVAPDSEAGDEEAPDDMAKTDEEVGRE